MPKKLLALLKDEATKNWQSYWKSLKPFFLHCALINFVKCFAILLQPQQPLFKRPSKKSIFQLCVKTKAEFGKMHLSAILEVSNAVFRQKAWRRENFFPHSFSKRQKMIIVRLHKTATKRPFPIELQQQKRYLCKKRGKSLQSCSASATLLLLLQNALRKLYKALKISK